MKMLLFLLLSLCGLSAAAQSADTVQLARWQQEGAWDRILAAVQADPAPAGQSINAAGFAAYQLGDRDEALRWFNKGLAADSNSRAAMYYAALIHKSEERERAAIPLLQRLCRLAPTNAGYFQLLGDCYDAINEDPAAATAYYCAYRIAPGTVALIAKLARSLQASDLGTQADTLLRSAMLRFPGNSALINAAISLAYSRKQYERCALLCDSLIATTKLNYRSLLSGLYADIARQDFRHAVRMGDVLIAMDVATEDILYYTAIAHQKLGEWSTADTLLRQCVAKYLKPQLNEVYDALADGAEAQGRFMKSKSYYDTAYYLFRKPHMLYRSGSMLEAHGLKEAAAPVYRQYLALPDGRQDTAVARYLRGRLGGDQKARTR